MIVKQNANLKELKKSIKTFFKCKKNLKQFSNVPEIINWNYIWKSYTLMNEDISLTDNNKLLKDYGVKNRSELFFKRNKFRKKL